MKISNSKKELASIISENGGWRDGANFSAQDKDGEVFHYEEKPTLRSGRTVWDHRGCIGHGEFSCEKLPNWHQTILSREEYFFLHQNQGLEDALDEPMVEAKPTIEQLAADYRNLLGFALRKQQEADDAKADADAKLKALEIAGEEHGLLVTPITTKKEPELVITDWRDLRVGDEIEVFNFECPWSESSRKQELMSGPCVVMLAEGGNVRIELKKNLPTKGPHWNATGIDACDFKFIRRP